MLTIKTLRRFTLIAAFVTPLFACGGTAEQNAEEQADDAIIINAGLLDMCRTAAADATATLGNDDDSDQLFSSGATYASSSCGRFVADFVVPSYANPADSHGTLDFIADGDVRNGFQGLNASDCVATRVYVKRYIGGASGFEAENSATYAGGYTAPTATTFGGCYPVLTAGDQANWHRPTRGTKTYRIAVRATRNGVAVPVEARIAFAIIPW